ncbi:VWA domain-containing protein [Candidatus Foliamicus sp.]
MTLAFEWAWAWLLLPLPLLVYRYLAPLKRGAGVPLRVPDRSRFAQVGETRETPPRATFDWALAALMYLCLLCAAARPVLLDANMEAPLTGRDLMLAVDLSGSMEVRDARLAERSASRLGAIKAVAGEFIERRAGDRVGLILFGGQAYLQAPLTFDRATVRAFLDESSVGLAGRQTALGDAIALAVKRMSLAGPAPEHRVLVLLTDGAATAGALTPLKAAELARAAGLKIYAIGIGSTRLMTPELSAELDEETLLRIAAITGGRYFRASQQGRLEEIYAELDRLEPVRLDQPDLLSGQPAHVPPLLIALLLGLTLAWRGR